MIHRIDKQTLAGAGVLRGVVVNQDINGIIVASSIAPAATDYVTVILKSELHGQEVLVNRINGLALASISDYRGGWSHNLQTQVVAGGGGAHPLYAYAIDLGCLRNIANRSTIEVIVEIAGASTVGVYTYASKIGSDYMHRYVQSNQLNQSFMSVEEIYAHTSASLAADWYSRDVNCMVRCNGAAVSSDLGGVFAAGKVLGNIEAEGPLYTARLFKAADDIPANVDVNLSGADTSTFSLISIEKLYMTVRVSRANIQTTVDTIGRLEAMGSDRASALKRAGVTPSVETLRLVLPSLNEGK